MYQDLFKNNMADIWDKLINALFKKYFGSSSDEGHCSLSQLFSFQVDDIVALITGWSVR